MILTAENYYSREANAEYMSCSQFKSFRECEAKAMAELNGDFQREASTALLVGSYVDSYFSGELDTFKSEHSEIFKKDGTLKAEYLQAERIIQRLEKDAFFMKYLGGEKQRIMTGVINNVPFKVKMDFYHEGKAIVDLKIVKDFQKIYDSKQKKRVPFIEFWGYDIQGAIYQEIVRQNTGEKLPFVIAGATKEAHADHNLIFIPQERLDECLKLVERDAPRYRSIKLSEIAPERCGKCDYCKDTKKVEGLIDYRYLGEENEDE